MSKFPPRHDEKAIFAVAGAFADIPQTLELNKPTITIADRKKYLYFTRVPPQGKYNTISG